MLNLFLFTNAYFEIGDIFSDWGNNWSQKISKWQYRIQKNSLKITLRKKRCFFLATTLQNAKLLTYIKYRCHHFVFFMFVNK